MHILLHPRCTFKELLGASRISKSTLSFHLSKLRKMKLVAKVKGEVKEGEDVRGRGYRVRREDELAALLITYKSSFLDEAVDRFVDLWLQI